MKELNNIEENDYSEEIRDIHVISTTRTSNNSIVNLKNSLGNTIFIVSSGREGYKKRNRKKIAAYKSVWNTLIKYMKKKQINTVLIEYCITSGASLRFVLPIMLRKSGIRVLSIQDSTAHPFNGCKLRRN